MSLLERLARKSFDVLVRILEAKGRLRRAKLARCNRVINIEAVARFPRLEPLPCNRPPNHAGDCCGIEGVCDYDEHNDPCQCGSPSDFGRGRCVCGGVIP